VALLEVVLIIAGLVALVFSADFAVKHVMRLAKFLSLSGFVVSFVIAGIVVILPELCIGIVAALEGTSSLGFGVILGANVADLTLVIGMVALYAGNLNLDSATLKQVKWSFAAVVLPVLLFWDAEISSIDGGILVLAYSVYMFLLLKNNRKYYPGVHNRTKSKFVSELAVVVVSLVVLFTGAGLVTENAQELSAALGLPLFLVGVVVAIGTCLPELVFSLHASKKNQGEIGLGNILGNVLADAMLTIGIIALIQPIRPNTPVFPMSTGVFMVVSALMVVLLSRKGGLNRKDGLLLLITYCIFLTAQTLLEGFIV